jgi:hypothetical protein
MKAKPANNGSQHCQNLLLLLALLVAAYVGPGMAQTNSAAVTAGAEKTTAERDGSHDFDFFVGTWKFHLKRRLKPLTGSNTWVEFDGIDVDRNILNGKANIDELAVDGPTGHVEGITLRLYNPGSHQWSLYWANGKAGVIGGPPNVGEFKNGRGEFYCQDTYNGRMIFIRYVWSDITPNSAHFEQSYSENGGTTWEVNWITDQKRISDSPDKPR